MLTTRRLPHAIILAGQEGAGKYTLAQMLAKAMLCQDPRVTDGLVDFCGKCAACLSVAEADDLDARFQEAVETREGMRDADRRETRILIQTHPDVLIVPPDPPQMMIKVDQVRHATADLALLPSQGKKKIYIFTDSCFMKEAANALLKALEEPPEFVHFLLLTPNPGELLPTIRSRCITLQLSPLATSEIETLLAERQPELKKQERALVARFSGGACGRALAFDLPAYAELRKEALILLAAQNRQDHSSLFQVTEDYRAGTAGNERMERLLRTLYILLQDLMYLKSGTADLIRNSDIQSELHTLAARADFSWLVTAANQLHALEAGMRRNLLRPVALDSFALSLEK
jgi:DNA polymerase-3 subunit delta'